MNPLYIVILYAVSYVISFIILIRVDLFYDGKNNFPLGTALLYSLYSIFSPIVIILFLIPRDNQVNLL